jgi:hypothetical protein
MLDKIAKHTPWVFEVLAPALVFTLGVYWFSCSIEGGHTPSSFASAAFLMLSVVLWLRNGRFIFRRIFGTAAALYVGPHILFILTKHLLSLSNNPYLTSLVETLNSVIATLSLLPIGWQFAFVVFTGLAGLLELYVVSYSNNDKFFTDKKNGLVVIPTNVQRNNEWTFTIGSEIIDNKREKIINLKCKLNISNRDSERERSVAEFYKDLRPVAQIFGGSLSIIRSEFSVNNDTFNVNELHDLSFKCGDNAKFVVAKCDVYYDSLPWYYKLFNLSAISFKFLVVDSDNKEHLVDEVFRKTN